MSDSDSRPGPLLAVVPSLLLVTPFIIFVRHRAPDGRQARGAKLEASAMTLVRQLETLDRGSSRSRFASQRCETGVLPFCW